MDQYLGEIRLFAFKSFVPMYWVKCDGTILNVQQNQALYALIGNTYGGTVNQTFAVPDLTGSEPDPNVMYCISVAGEWPQRQ